MTRYEISELIKYIQAALHRATYDILEDDSSFYGELPELPGVYATAETLKQCRDRLQEVLEAWILLGLHLHHPTPVLDEIVCRSEAG